MKIVDIIIVLVLAILMFVAGNKYIAYTREKKQAEIDSKALGLKNV